MARAAAPYRAVLSLLDPGSMTCALWDDCTWSARFLGTSCLLDALIRTVLPGPHDEDDWPYRPDRGSRAPAARRQRDPEPGRGRRRGDAGVALRVVHHYRAALRLARGPVTAPRMPTSAASLSASASRSPALERAPTWVLPRSPRADVPPHALHRVPRRWDCHPVPGPGGEGAPRPLVLGRGCTAQRADWEGPPTPSLHVDPSGWLGTSRTWASMTWSCAGAVIAVGCRCDPDYRFDDPANAIPICLDLGVDIASQGIWTTQLGGGAATASWWVRSGTPWSYCLCWTASCSTLKAAPWP